MNDATIIILAKLAVLSLAFLASLGRRIRLKADRNRGDMPPSPDQVFGVAPVRANPQTSGAQPVNSGGLDTRCGGLSTSSGGLSAGSGGLPEQRAEDQAAQGRIRPDFDRAFTTRPNDP